MKKNRISFCSRARVIPAMLAAVSAWTHAQQPAGNAAANDGRPKSVAEAFQMIYSRLGTVPVYGRVVDQWTNGVEEADVRISWDSAAWMIGGPRKDYDDWAKTDVRGFFSATLDHPERAFAYPSKDGYATTLGNSSGDMIENRTSKDKPAVVFLRKKGEVSFLFTFPDSDERRKDVLLKISGTNALSRPFDLLAWDSEYGWKKSAATNADLRADAVFDAGMKRWRVTYSVTNSPGGVILSDKLLYEAPLDGYAPSMSATLTDEGRQSKYLYLKSRTPTVHSRVGLEYWVGG
jgi:hypothetical protein